MDFEYFFDQSLCGFLITDPQGIILRGNGRLASWTGHSISELKGKKVTDLFTIGGKIYYETHLSPLLKMQGSFDEVVVEIKDHAGQKLRVLINALECRDKDGLLSFIHFTLVKASDRLLYEQNLQIAKSTAEKDLLNQTQAVRLREQLIAVLGHDLRNPLSSITMAAEILQSAELNPGEAEVVQTLKRSSSRMAELISNVMDFAKTRLGEGMVISSRDVMLKPVLHQVIDELKTIYPERNIIAEFDVTEPVHCDPDRIGQLLSNLLANALTHGNASTPVYIRAFHNNKVLELSISNNGNPIPESIKGTLFEPFTRERNRPSQNGLGLGLYISSEIAKAHNATLICVSDENETRFTFRMLTS